MKKKLFIISSRVPFPLDKGDKLRLFHQLRYLSDHFEICLCSLDDTKVSDAHLTELKKVVPNTHVIPLKKGRIYLNLLMGIFGRRPYQVYYFFQRKSQQKIDQIIKDFQPDHIYCQLLRAAEYVKGYHNISKTIDYQDAFSKGIERRIETASWLKSIFRSEHKRLLKYENLIFDYFDKHTIISEEDRNFIFHEKRNEIRVIPNGIDSNFFTPNDIEKKYDLLFVGNMSYAPNVDSVTFIVKEILPLLRKTYPEIKLLIAGANPSAEVKKLEEKNVEISGWIEDIRDAYGSAKIFLAPMRIGSGLQNKLLEAMSMELPCITSPLANKSLKSTDGNHTIICETAEENADAISRLLSSETLYKLISKNGREFVKTNFSWKKSVNELADLINEEL
ncbi:MAG: glycosyltransferase [Flavobacteriales bacterium]|nr:glycosyltransferase [Flavobacteriales bacterium]